MTKQGPLALNNCLIPIINLDPCTSYCCFHCHWQNILQYCIIAVTVNQFELAPVCSSATSSVWMVSTLCGRFCKSFVCRSFLFYLCVFSPYLEFLSGLFFRFPFSQSKFSNCELQKLPKHDACPDKI